MMSALDNPWKPLNKGTTTLSWTTVPLLVFLSTPGTPTSRPQTQSLLQTLDFKVQDKGAPDPDFYMPDGQGKRLSEMYQMYTTKKTPDDNPGVLVKLPNLEKKYGTSMFLMDKKSGHLYIAGIEGYK